MESTPFVVLPFVLMLIVGLMVPSDGNHGLFSMKSLTFLGTAGLLMLYLFIRQKFTFTQLKALTLFVFLVTCFLAVLMNGLGLGETTTASLVDQFKLFFLTSSVVMFGWYLVDEEIIQPVVIFKTVIYANFCYSFLKISVLALHFLKLINMWTVLTYTGLRFMTMDITSGFMRMQTSVDIVTPFLLFFVLQSDNLGFRLSKKFKILYCLISLAAIAISFSRFLIMVACLSFLLHWATLSLPRIAVRLFFASIFVTAIAGAIGFEKVGQAVEKRLFSTDNYHSDQIRVEQIEALADEYYKYPLLGKGMGGYAPNLIRDGTLQHSYEVQWMAFLMQFGAVGILCLLLPLGVIMTKLIMAPFSRVRWGFGLLYLSWLLSGFTNPFLISLLSGIVYLLFLTAARCLRDDAERRNSSADVLHPT